jgi:Fe-S-cluster containining protein
MCCNRGPQMELSEATALADKFITSLFFRVYSLPLHKRAAQSRQARGGGLRVAEALEEERDTLSHFSTRDEIDKSKRRSLHLTISALTVDREKGRCPALVENLCTIYESRPFSCRTVPMHYSRPSSALGSHLDEFVRTPGYSCDTTMNAPVVFDGQAITDPSVKQARDEAFKLAQSERAWKAKLVSLMDDPGAASAAGLPTYEDVLRYADGGSAAAVSMLIAWRVARDAGLISAGSFEEICRKQIALIDSELERVSDVELTIRLLELRSDYELELAKGRNPLPQLGFPSA